MPFLFVTFRFKVFALYILEPGNWDWAKTKLVDEEEEMEGRKEREKRGRRKERENGGGRKE